MRVFDVFISGTGTFLPDRMPIGVAVGQGLLDAGLADAYGFTGVTIAGDLAAPDMALRASEQALRRSGQDPARLSLVLYVSTWYQGPHGWCPQYHIQRHTGAGQATAAEVRQGCMGMFSAVELACAHLMVSAGHEAALLTLAENFQSPMLDRWRSAPHSLLGDGACAMVLNRQGGFARVRSVNSVTLPEFEARHRPAAPLFPPDATLGTKLDLGAAKKTFERAAPDVSEIPAKMARAQHDIVTATLREAGLTMSDVTRVAFVNWSRQRVTERAVLPLGVPLSAMTWEFGRTIGHLGASDQVISLDHLLTAGELRRGDHVLMLGTGPGANVAAIALEILNAPATW